MIRPIDRRESSPPRASKPSPSGSVAGWLDVLGAGLAGALFTLRLLVPTEASVFGETLWITQGWFLVALLWIWSAYRRGGAAVRVRRADLGIGCLVLGHVVAALIVVCGEGDKRSAMNLLWEWLAVGVSYAWFRQALASPFLRQGFTAIFLALLVALAGFGIWQRYVWYPAAAAQYSAVRDELDKLEAQADSSSSASASENLRRMAKLRQQLFDQGVTEQMQSGAGRILFEGRLKESREPFGKFALANTFAGLLLVGVVLLISLLPALTRDASDRHAFAATGLAVGLAGWCLLLTKSRTAFIGTTVGLAVWGAERLWNRSGPVARPICRRVAFGIATGAVLLALSVAGLAFSGGLDRLVLTEAPKSLQYRLEYWQGTWQIIRRHPLLGVGPGNFRQHYLQFKLPQASEEIADPHNLFFDAWASGGLLALCGAIGLGIVAVQLVWRGNGGSPVHGSDAFHAAGADLWRNPPVWGTALGMAGLYLWTLALDHSLPAIGLGGGLLLAIAGKAWNDHPLPTSALGAALLGVCVHLLGAGGIGMPAIVQVIAWLLASGLATVDGDHQTELRSPRGYIGMGLVALLLSSGCYFTATRPVSIRDAALENGDEARTLAQREADYRRAAMADPLSSLPWERLAGTRFQQWKAGGGREDSLFDQALEFEWEAIRRNPLNFVQHQTLGELAWKKYLRSRNRADAALAVAGWTRAAELYPNSATLQAQWATACEAAGERQQAQYIARRALQLDDINRTAGHRDKFLADPIRAELERILTEPLPTPRFPTGVR